MFCLRSWIPILFFLTNASPIYLLLFITATYILNRPCVYCSLLLAILVLSLFDFRTSWFPQPDTDIPASSPLYNNNQNYLASQSCTAAHPRNTSCAHGGHLATSSPGGIEAIIDSSPLLAVLNSTLEAIFTAGVEEIKKRLPGAAAASASAVSSGPAGAAVDVVVEAAADGAVVQSAGWVSQILAKREWRVPCLDVLVRL